MSTRTSRWPAGTPCWADLTVPDVDAAQAFYGPLFGWSFDVSGPEYGGYAMATMDGHHAAGIGPSQEGMPTVWTLYLASDDADATGASIKEHGGSVLAEPFDVGPLGRMLVAADPTGAAFGVWQAKDNIGANVVNQPGALTWDDLHSTDATAAAAFYRDVFGYRVEAMPEAGEDYQLFHLAGDDAPSGGMGGMFGAPDGTPSHWVVYFGVDDAAAAVDTATANGGTVMAPPFDTPYGKMAGLLDPFGAMFWIAQTDVANQPDRSG